MGCGLGGFRRQNLLGAGGAAAGAVIRVGARRKRRTLRREFLVGAEATTCRRRTESQVYRMATWACWASRAGDWAICLVPQVRAPARRAPAAGRRGLGRESRRSAPGGGDAQPRRHPCGARIADAGAGGASFEAASGPTWCSPIRPSRDPPPATEPRSRARRRGRRGCRAGSSGSRQA